MKKNELLEAILEDRRRGYNLPWLDYLVFLEPYDDRDRALNRIHKTVSRYRDLINQAENEYLQSLKPETNLENKKKNISIEEY